MTGQWTHVTLFDLLNEMTFWTMPSLITISSHQINSVWFPFYIRVMNAVLNQLRWKVKQNSFIYAVNLRI